MGYFLLPFQDILRIANAPTHTCQHHTTPPSLKMELKWDFWYRYYEPTEGLGPAALILAIVLLGNATLWGRDGKGWKGLWPLLTVPLIIVQTLATACLFAVAYMEFRGRRQVVDGISPPSGWILLGCGLWYWRFWYYGPSGRGGGPAVRSAVHND